VKVLYVCLDPGVPVGSSKGAAVHVWEMVRALDQEGHDVALVAREVVAAPATLAQITVTGRTLRGRRLPVIGALLTTADRRRVRRQLARAIKRFRPEVIYERYALGQTVVSAIAHRHAIRHVLEVNAPLADERARAAGRAPDADDVAAEQATWRAADLVAVPSHPLAEMVRATGQPHVIVTPNAVDPELFRVQDEPLLRYELGLDDRLVIGFAGTARPWHDLGTVVDAVAQLPTDLRPALLIIGEQPPADIVVAATRQNVELVVTGPMLHPLVPRYLATVDIAVASLRAEPQFTYFSPLKALEYLAAGRPAVVADVGDLHLLVAKGAALPYRAGDAASLAEALQRVATDAELRARLVDAGRTFAETRTWRAVARTVMHAVDGAPAAGHPHTLVAPR
jgi:glycosyltransferase involved in cell wall biosynthesis